jgi:hypothetical protein
MLLKLPFVLQKSATIVCFGMHSNRLLVIQHDEFRVLQSGFHSAI